MYSHDGTLSVNIGGVEMGQGLHTKMLQIAAYTLNVPFEYIEIGTTSTEKVILLETCSFVNFINPSIKRFPMLLVLVLQLVQTSMEVPLKMHVKSSGNDLKTFWIILQRNQWRASIHIGRNPKSFLLNGRMEKGRGKVYGPR